MAVSDETLVASESSPTSVVEKMNSSERKTWLETGKLPEEKSDQPGKTGDDDKSNESSEASSKSGSDESKESQRVLSPAEKRIKQLLSDNKRLKAEIAAGKTPPETKREETPKAAPKAEASKDAKPKPDEKTASGELKFKTYEEYMDAAIEYGIQQGISAHETRKAEEQKTATIEKKNKEIVESWQKRVESAREKHPDFDEVALADDLPIRAGSVVDQFILDSEVGTDVLHALGKDRKLLEKINGLHPIAAARELVKLESSFNSGTAPTKKKVTDAPPPVSEVGSRGSSARDDIAEAVKAGDFAVYRSKMNAKELSARKG